MDVTRYKKFIPRTHYDKPSELQFLGLPDDDIFAVLLKDRDIRDLQTYNRYIQPDISDLNDPFLLPDMQKAVDRIILARDNHEKVCIYGDYDADGVCATVILLKRLRSMGIDTDYYIPKRHSEGYGMNTRSLEPIIQSGKKLIITVDNGITAYDEIDYCTGNGIDVIVTDHHLPGEVLPQCTAVVSAKRRDSAYPSEDLCGAGVAFKLCCALSDGEIDKELLGLASVATMADIVPLRDENRTIVKIGCQYISNNIGLRTLIKKSGITPNPRDFSYISFAISPRLNAPGRVSDAELSVRLLMAEDIGEVNECVDAIEECNSARKQKVEDVTNDVENRHGGELKKAAVVLNDPNWDIGVLGIAASRLTKELKKPVILFSEKGNDLTGSGRSVEEIPLYDSLVPFEKYFLRFGGHARAVGLTVPKSGFVQFKDEYTDYIESLYGDACCADKYPYDFILDPDSVSIELYKQIYSLAPFGECNKEPVFLLRDAYVSNVRAFGRNFNHLEMSVKQSDSTVRIIGFGIGNEMELFKQNPHGDFLVQLSLNEYMGRASVELLMMECLLYKPGLNEEDLATLKEIKDRIVYKNSGEYDIIIKLFLKLNGNTHQMLSEMDEDSFRDKYRDIVRGVESGVDPLKGYLSDPEILFAACVFMELGFIYADSDQVLRKTEQPLKKSLQESALFTRICGLHK